MSGPIEELMVLYDPRVVAEKLQRRRAMLRSRIVSLVITVVLVVGFYVWQRSRGPAVIWVSVVVVIISAAWTAAYLAGYLRVRRELAGVGQGTAVRIGRGGVQVADLVAAWPEVLSLKAVKPGIGVGPRLELARVDGSRAAVPFDHIGVRPATLDSTARAYSGGRHGVDLQALDN
jgi:hypothetical protein